jgi:hypothetical protein
MDGRFATVPKPLLDNQNLVALDTAVYAALDSFANNNGEAWPSLRSLAERAKVSPATVKRSLPRLESAGYIVRQRRHAPGQKEFDSTFYRLPFRRGEAGSEMSGDGSKRTEVGSPEHEGLAPSAQKVGSERDSNENHITRPIERDCAGDPSARSNHTVMVSSMFEELWERYPRKSGKGEAKKRFIALFPVELSPEERNKRMRAINERFLCYEKECEERIARGEERFIPYLHRWLDGEDFTDV